ncbi:uncharacterized protein [Amphiura filiformis]|uniref:uncharacterized protein isoform X2 n=1 Tax=Amphiura filiformis TaxID=82378 RepID=UPI003B21BA37
MADNEKKTSKTSDDWTSEVESVSNKKQPRKCEELYGFESWEDFEKCQRECESEETDEDIEGKEKQGTQAAMSDIRVKEEEDEDCDPLLTLPVTDDAFDSAPSTFDHPEQTRLYIKTTLILDQILNHTTAKKSNHQIPDKALLSNVMKAIAAQKSVTLKNTPKLCTNVKNLVYKLWHPLQKVQKQGGRQAKRFVSNVRQKNSWRRLTVLADEFEIREEFERCQLECAIHEANVVAEIEMQKEAEKLTTARKDADEMTDEEEINERSVPLRTCPFAEKEKITLDVVTDFVFEEIRKPNGLRKPFCELVEDVVNALCQHNSVRLKKTPRLLHQVKKYVSELVGKWKKRKGKRDESSSNMEDIDTKQRWECMVLADEFESRDDFERCQRMCQSGNADQGELEMEQEICTMGDLDVKKEKEDVTMRSNNSEHDPMFAVTGEIPPSTSSGSGFSEDTSLHVEPYFLLKQIKSADPKLSNADLIDFIFQQICHHKSVTLHHTPRLISQMRKYISCGFGTERRRGGSIILAKYSDIVCKKPSWTCKVLADEFVYREEFERCRREAAEYEAQVKADKYAEMAIKEEMKEEAFHYVFLSFCRERKSL